MKAIVPIIGLLMLLFPSSLLKAQTSQPKLPTVITGFHSLSKALTDYPLTTSAAGEKPIEPLSPLGVLASFDGQYETPSEIWPPDPCGDVNSQYYAQTVVNSIAVYTRSGQLVWGPVPCFSLFGNLPGTGTEFRSYEWTLLYDDQANRWLLAQISRQLIYPNPCYFMIAVSSTSNPAGSWNAYSFPTTNDVAWASFGIWRDAYYSTNLKWGLSETRIIAFERSAMISGGTARAITIDVEWPEWGMDPVDNDGAFAPEGTPGLFISLNDTASNATGQQFWVYGMHADWVNPANSTFGVIDKIDVAKTNNHPDFFTWYIPQKGSLQKLQVFPGISSRTSQYRNFGSYQSMVCSHTVNLDTGTTTFHSGICWYEFRKTGNNPWALRQQGIIGGDSDHRWLSSTRLNGDNTIGIGYTVSGSNTYPSIRYCGQSKTAYALANSVMDYAEDTILAGRFSQEGSSFWGAIAALAVDASNDRTFWFTSEYIDSVNNRATRIASFRYGKYPIVKTLPATSIIAVAATLNGTVNPQGLATTWHFEWGTSFPYSDSSAVASAGSGNTPQPVSFSLSGLTMGVTYHYRLVGENADGRIEGNDMTVTPGAAAIITRAITNIGVTSAVSGGDISADGGAPITERGVCWGKNLNPDITGSHTSDGPGIGSFMSQIDGLERFSFYHVRAYAVNFYGTWYGQDRTFVTLCGDFTPPFSETFVSPWLPECWSLVDRRGNNQVWRVGKLNSVSPMPLLDGNYAYINSDEYGSAGIQDADLISAVIDCSAYADISLSFQHFFNADLNSTGEVSYSTNGGISWTSLHTFTATSATNPETYSVNIPEASGKAKVMFRWNYKAAFSLYWAVDNILVSGNAVNTLSVTPTIQKVPVGPASSINYTVQSNVSWTAASNKSWCTVTPSSTGNGTLVANYEVNPTHQSRTADITVSATGRPPVVVYLEQARSTVGVDEPGENDIRIYPNPSNGKITVVAGNNPGEAFKVTVWDVTGRNILEQEFKGSHQCSLDLGSAPEGIYFLRISAGTWTATRKIVIVR